MSVILTLGEIISNQLKQVGIEVSHKQTGFALLSVPIVKDGSIVRIDKIKGKEAVSLIWKRAQKIDTEKLDNMVQLFVNRLGLFVSNQEETTLTLEMSDTQTGAQKTLVETCIHNWIRFGSKVPLEKIFQGDLYKEGGDGKPASFEKQFTQNAKEERERLKEEALQRQSKSLKDLYHEVEDDEWFK